MGKVAGRFARVEPRRRARAFVLGLLADLPRKNCWTIAEHAGNASPAGMQHLLSRARWDADRVRDDIRDFVVEHLGDEDAVLVVDETGDLKKGTASVGVQRQYTGTAGRIENSQVAVYLVYASAARARRHRPPPLHPTVLDPGPAAVPLGRHPRRPEVRDQARPGHRDDRPGPGRRSPGQVGHR